MDNIYIPYYISNYELQKAFTALIQSFEPLDEQDHDLIRKVCKDLNDADAGRIIALEHWLGGLDWWRLEIPEWSPREAEYVINCLRWEYYQAHTTFRLNKEREEKRSNRERWERNNLVKTPPESPVVPGAPVMHGAVQ